MPFPSSVRVIYNHNPLVEVVCQLKFPTILRVSTGDIANFQDKIREEYPLYESKEPSFEFVNVPKELSAIVAMFPFPKPPGVTNIHKFLKNDKTRFISLSQDFLAFSDNDYKKWDLFSAEVKKAEKALREIFQPAFYSRIGLRYRDMITPQELGLSDCKWKDLLQKHIIGELGDARVADNISEIKTRAVIQIPEVPGGYVTLIHGLVTDKVKSQQSYLIDADFAIEGTEDTNGAIGLLSTFNRLAGRLFRWAISDTLHEAMGPQTV